MSVSIAPPGAADFAGVDTTALLAALPDPVVLLRPDGSWVPNAAARQRLGEAGEPGGDWAGGDWAAALLPETAERLRAAVAQARAGHSSRLTVKLDALAPALVTVTPAGSGAALLHLRAAHDPLEVAVELMDGLGLGLTVQDAQTRILYANASAQAILGLSLEQLTGRDSLDPRWRAIHPDGQPFPGETHPSARALQTGEPVRDVPMGVFHPAPPSDADPEAGTWRWLTVTAIPRRALAGEKPKQVTTVFADVTAQRRAEAEVRRSEERFRSLVEATAQIVFTTDAQGRFNGPQPDWETFTGQGPQDYLHGQRGLLAIHPEDREPSAQAWRAAVQSRTSHDVEHRLRRADGVYVPMRARAVPVLNEDGSVREWIGTHTDISAVREAEAALRALNAELEGRVALRTQELAEVTRFSTLLLTAAGEGVFGLDAAGRTTFANPAAARLVGYSVERLIGSRQHDLIHHRRPDGTPYPEEDCPVHQTLRDGQTRRLDHDVLWHAQGHPVAVSSVVTPLRAASGEVSGAVLMVQDITERVRAQAQLQEAVADLERSNADLEQFAYVASHDLQEPLRTIGSYTELLARRYGGQLDDRADRYLTFMQDAVGRMKALIQDLLAFSRVGRAEATPRPVALDDVLRIAAQNVQAALTAGGAALTWTTPHRVLGHASLLAPLLTNLIGNGLKFTPPGQPARVQVTSRREDAWIHVMVTDGGIGIAPEYHERVFDIFQRLHRREDYAGNGMGLAICRKIVEHHGGRLWLDSTPGQGSTFHLTLPAAPPSSQDPLPPQP